MVLRVAINGFGRIGRMVLRAGIHRKDIEFVVCNDLTNKENLAYLFKHDSAHGAYEGTVEVTTDGLRIDDKHILIVSETDPTLLPWKALDIDVVVESTGHFRTKELMQEHIDAGAKQVLLSAPAKGNEIPTIVLGVNEHEFDLANEPFLSNASCTTNSLAPIIKVLDDNFGVESGFMTTIHSFTGDQRLVDAPHADPRRGRSAAINIVPTTTGAAKAVGYVLPHLQGKLDGIAVRVPTPDGSLTDVVCQLKHPATKEQINHLFSEVAKYHLKNILEYSDQPLVSTDIVNNPHSTIVDASLTKVYANTVKICTWYDNEWGYSKRVVDLLALIASKKEL